MPALPEGEEGDAITALLAIGDPASLADASLSGVTAIHPAALENKT